MKIELKTKHPIAIDSPDYQNPWGTRRDNSRNSRFNKKLYGLFPDKILRILDLGCSGGGFIQGVIEDGHIGVGLEGSDWSKNLGRGAWGKIPTLFTCDITRPFEILEDGKPMKFDVITAWEVMEHIKEKDLPQTIKNIKNHLAEEGLFIGSISQNEEVIDDVKLHNSVHSEEWWVDKFYKDFDCWSGEGKLIKRYFNGQYLRKDEGSFIIILTHKNTVPVFFSARLPSFLEKLHDCWHGSKFQKRIKQFLQ